MDGRAGEERRNGIRRISSDEKTGDEGGKMLRRKGRRVYRDERTGED